MSCGSSAVFTYTQKLCEKLTKIFRFFARFSENIPFRMRIRIQEPTECASRSETLFMIPKNHLKNFVFGRRLQEHKNICKNFCKNKNSHENEHFCKNFCESKNKFLAKNKNYSVTLQLRLCNSAFRYCFFQCCGTASLLCNSGSG
jgi:hypothetical protein